jgi:type I restriction enzyme S subunit
VTRTLPFSLSPPPEWEVHPFGRIVDRVQESGQPEARSLSVFIDQGVVPRDSRDDNFNRLGADLAKYLVVHPGDIVFNKLRTWQGGLGVSKFDGIVSPAYFVCRPRANISPQYLHYLLRSRVYLEELTRISKWMPPSQFDISWDDLRSLSIMVPPISTQRAIADYLDRETARIDALIAAKQRMVTLLEERLRVTISEAAEEGRPMKLRRVVVLRTTGPRGWGDLVADSGEPFIRSANLRRDDIELQTDELVHVVPPVSQEATRSRTRPGDVLIGVTGANTGWVGIVRDNFAHGYVSQHVAILRPGEQLLPEWLGYSLFSERVQDQLISGQYGGTKQQLGLEDLAELVIQLPDQNRQRALVARLERAKSASRRAITALSQQMSLLEERRQALITAAVTGQLDIPEAA